MHVYDAGVRGALPLVHKHGVELFVEGIVYFEMAKVQVGELPELVGCVRDGLQMESSE